MMEDTRRIQFWCLEHGASFVASAGEGVTVFCENKEDNHEFARDFPGEAFWEYCCDCERFFALRRPQEDLGLPSNSQCPACGRASSLRFLCAVCNVVSFESWEAVNRSQDFSISPTNGRLKPCCPGCREVPGGEVSSHKCRHQRMGFTTTRERCPFCRETLRLDSPELQEGDGLSRAALAATAAEAATVAALLPAAEPVLQLTDGDGHHSGPGGVVSPPPEAVAQPPAVEGEPGGARDSGDGVKAAYLALIVSLHERWRRYVGAALGLIAVVGLLLTPPIKDWLRARLVNHRPVIKMVSPEKTTVNVGGSVRLVANVQDEDGDTLHYDWQPQKGRIDGDSDRETVVLNLAGSNVESGEALRVRLFVRDSDVTSDPYDAVIQVSLNHRPQLLQLQSSAPQVYVGELVRLTAHAEDDDRDPLTYNWSSSGGFFEGDTTRSTSVVLNTTGVNILASSAPVEVTLTVRDGRDASDLLRIPISVVPRPQDKEPAPAPQAEEAKEQPAVIVDFPDGDSVAVGGRLRLRAIPDNADGDELRYEWHPDDPRVLPAEAPRRSFAEGPDVTLDTAALNPVISPRTIYIRLAVRNVRSGLTRNVFKSVKVLPADTRRAAPVPATHPEPTPAPQSPTPTPVPAAPPGARPPGPLT